MFEADDIREWREKDVVDVSGDKIGALEAIYFDTATDEPAFGTVRTGLVSKKLLFVPLGGARVSPKHLRVTVSKSVVKEAPSIETDGELSAAQEPAVFAHYGLPYRSGASGERRLGRR